jgi:hypothetical protein
LRISLNEAYKVEEFKGVGHDHGITHDKLYVYPFLIGINDNYNGFRLFIPFFSIENNCRSPLKTAVVTQTPPEVSFVNPRISIIPLAAGIENTSNPAS